MAYGEPKGGLLLVLTEGIPAITLAPSDYIAASGENTTSQLTGGTGSFAPGRMQDDENPADAVDIGTDGNTELEWCIKATDAVATDEVYGLRVTKDGVPLDTYTDTPLWTIGTGGGAVLISQLRSIHRGIFSRVFGRVN